MCLLYTADIKLTAFVKQNLGLSTNSLLGTHIVDIVQVMKIFTFLLGSYILH